MNGVYHKHTPSAPSNNNHIQVAIPVGTRHVAAPGAAPAALSAAPAAPPPFYIDNPALDRRMRGAWGQRTFLHKVFLLIRILTGLTGCNNIIAQLVALSFHGNMPMEVLLRCYTIGLCVLVILIEAEHQKTKLVKESLILQNWVSRGVFYNFLGVLGVVQYDIGTDNYYNRNNNNNNNQYNNNNKYYTVRIPTLEDAGECYIWFNSWVMFAMGVVYIVMGILCLEAKLQQLRQDYQAQIKRQQQQQQQQGRGPASF
jgi:hypothetical protein